MEVVGNRGEDESDQPFLLLIPWWPHVVHEVVVVVVVAVVVVVVAAGAVDGVAEQPDSLGPIS